MSCGSAEVSPNGPRTLMSLLKKFRTIPENVLLELFQAVASAKLKFFLSSNSYVAVKGTRVLSVAIEYTHSRQEVTV